MDFLLGEKNPTPSAPTCQVFFCGDCQYCVYVVYIRHKITLLYYYMSSTYIYIYFLLIIYAIHMNSYERQTLKLQIFFRNRSSLLLHNLREVPHDAGQISSRPHTTDGTPKGS